MAVHVQTHIATNQSHQYRGSEYFAGYKGDYFTTKRATRHFSFPCQAVTWPNSEGSKNCAVSPRSWWESDERLADIKGNV